MRLTSPQNAYVFAASDGGNGNELWIAGAGLSGPRLLKDIRPGMDGADPGDFTPLADGRLLFVADDGIHGRELWVTDGTKAGTHLLRDIGQGDGSNGPDILASLGERALFSVDDGVNGRELWVTDGTAGGTHLFRDINAGAPGSDPAGFTRMTSGQWLFTAKTAEAGTEVWVTDGTAEGTRLVADLVTSSDKRTIMLSPDGQDAYIQDGYWLWRTDGTAEGTVGLGKGWAPLNNDHWLFFQNLDGSKYATLHITDGTPEGTNGFTKTTASSLIPFGDGRALLQSGNSLFVIDAKAEGPALFHTGVGYYPTFPLSDFMPLGDGHILFTSILGVVGDWSQSEFWITDGTADGTVKLAALSADVPRSLPDSFTRLEDGAIVFSAPSFNDPNAVWKLDAGLGSIEQLGGVQFSAGTTFHALAIPAPLPEPHQWSERLPLFDIAYYLKNNLDVAASGMDPLDHFLDFGGQEGRSPSASFDSAFYLSQYPDVAASGLNPFLHFLAYGQQEGRVARGMDDAQPLPPEAGSPDMVALARHLLESRFQPALPETGGETPAIRPEAPLVDTAFYLAAYVDVAAAGADPVTHYMTYGWQESRDPNALFDTSYYLGNNADVRVAGVNPMDHYLEFGAREGRDPSALFDTLAYLAQNGDVANAGVNPLAHYLQWGMMEGREIFPT